MINKVKKAFNINNRSERSISSEEFLKRVQEKAYELYEKRGCESGHDFEDWVMAEKLIKEELSK